MLIDPGHHLGDAWFHVERSGLVHAYVLRCPDDVPRHTDWHVAHATSTDLVHWELHGPVLAGAGLATGSVAPDPSGGWTMAVTVGWDRPRPAIGLSRSDDLAAWGPPVEVSVAPDVAPYAVARPFGPRPETHWRDPYLTVGPDGERRMLVCAARTDRPPDASGTIGVLDEVAPGRWEPGPPLAVDAVARELECPQVIEVDGCWFLVFSTWPPLFSAPMRHRWGERLRPGTYAMAGPGPEGPFVLARPEPIVPAGAAHQPYAGQVVTVDGRPLLLGTCWSDDGPDAISDPLELVAVDDGLVGR